MTRDEIAEYSPELMLLEPSYFDEAILGVVFRINTQAVCYDKNKVIELLIREDKMTEEEAYEHFDFNIIGSWVGQYTPVYLETAL